jgi:broad specificity phosphatase PhoE
MRRLLLVRHASTAALRRAAFPLDEELDAAGLQAASALRGRWRGEAMCSPSARTRATAVACGLDPVEVPSLAECDFGSWGGRTLTEVWAADPAAAEAWMTDPDATPHGGESLRELLARVRGWMDAEVSRSGTAVVFTHGGVIKAALVNALDAAPAAFWRVDVAPLHLTELHGRDGRWTVTSVNAPAAPVARRGEDTDAGRAPAAGRAG